MCSMPSSSALCHCKWDIAGNCLIGLRAILPENTLTHFCVITGWDTYNETLGRYAEMLGVNPPTPGIAGGFSSNGTYNGKRLVRCMECDELC